MTKYIVYRDFRATAPYTMGYAYDTIEAKTDFEAIEMADKMYDEDSVYLIRIMKKEGKARKSVGNWKVQRYTAVMCKRSNKGGWHKNTKDNAETVHEVDRCYTRSYEWFERVSNWATEWGC